MKPIKRSLITGYPRGPGIRGSVDCRVGCTADAGAPPQETAEAPESTAEEPLPDFQPIGAPPRRQRGRVPDRHLRPSCVAQIQSTSSFSSPRWWSP